jgi:histidine triad (HIT) family protein
MSWAIYRPQQMTLDPDPECLFCKIVGGEIPASIVLRDELVTAFRDINPQMPVHVLVVPNQHIANTEALEAEHDALVGAMVRAAAVIARQEGIAERGYRLVFNTGRDASNTVPHLHLHVLGGRSMTWPPG